VFLPVGVELNFFVYSVVISTPVQCFIKTDKNWGMKTVAQAAD